MTQDEMAFWEKAFLAAIPAAFGTDNGVTPFDSMMKDGALRIADAALAVWRDKRRELVTVDLHAQRVRDDRSIAEGMDNGALQP